MLFPPVRLFVRGGSRVLDYMRFAPSGLDRWRRKNGEATGVVVRYANGVVYT